VITGVLIRELNEEAMKGSKPSKETGGSHRSTTSNVSTMNIELVSACALTVRDRLTI